MKKHNDFNTLMRQIIIDNQAYDDYNMLNTAIFFNENSDLLPVTFIKKVRLKTPDLMLFKVKK